MLALSDLIKIVSDLTGIPEATVFAYGRFAREAGLISQTGRAKKTAMTVRDISNLLIAICGTDITRDAGNAIKLYRAMPIHTLGPGFPATEWRDENTKLCLANGEDASRETFGEFFDRMVSWSLSGKLESILGRIESVLIFPDTQRRLEQRLADPETTQEWRRVYEHQLKSAGQPGPVFMEFSFSRTKPVVSVRIKRYWENIEDYDGIDFFGLDDPTKYSARYAHDFHVTGIISNVTLAALSHAIRTDGFSVGGIG